jgi:Uncharacterized protein conserved in bacteria
MTDLTRETGAARGGPIPFAERFAASDVFRDLFREGMGLVEETAAYLDGDGRAHSRTLSRAASLAYATESMRLTTRLMQMASWLLLQRAVNEGEITQAEANSERNRVRLDDAATRRAAEWNDLPAPLRDLIDRSFRLQDRIRHLAGAISAPAEIRRPVASPVSRHMDLLADAFGRGAAPRSADA